MTRHLLSYVTVALSSLALVGQQVPQVSMPASLAPESQSPAAVTPAAPAQQPPANILQDGTPMKLRLLNSSIRTPLRTAKKFPSM